MKRRIGFKILNAIVAATLIFGTIGFTASAAISGMDMRSSAKKDEFNYVSLGASNVNGYGLRGYNFDIVYEAPLEKENNNLYGYKMDTPGSYPVLIKERLSEKYNVNLSQLAISSMRAEELRFLLDDSYTGDGYTDVWFYDINGDGFSLNYFYGAGLLEWNNRKAAGVPGYDHEPDADEILATLRDEYRTTIKNADLITVDVGMNNFGTYLGNPLENDLFSSDLSVTNPQANEYYQYAKEFILEVIEDNMGDVELPEETLNLFLDTFAYALAGYCLNLDTSIAEIYALNPDADIVVVGVQNIMHGLEATIPGLDSTLPLGEIFATIVNAANLYTAVLSPHCEKYYFADVCSQGHVDFFIDELREYNGNPATLSQNIKDCFDLYDTDFLIKTRIQQMYAVQMNQMGFVNMTDEQKDMASTEGLNAFYYGFHNDIYPDKSSAITISGGTLLKDFFKMGEDGKLGDDAKGYYEMYEKMLTVAYDVIGEIMREAANVTCFDLGVMMSMGDIDASAFSSIFAVLGNAIGEALTKQDYSFDINTLYPDGFFKTIAAEYGLTEGLLDTLLSFALHMDTGSGFFAHPSPKGYEEICDIILNAYEKEITGKDVIADQMGIYYLPDEDSYYVAVSSGDAKYAEMFGEAIGLKNGQIGHTNWNDIDYSKIDNADLISIGFNENEMLGFASDQMMAYIGNYISTDLRGTLKSYVGSIVDSVPLLSSVGFKPKAMEMVDNTINEAMKNELFAGKTMVELEWESILDETQLPYIELAKSQIKDAVSENLGSDEFVVSFDVVEWLRENADSFGTSSIVTSLLKNSTLLYSILGDNAVFELSIPIGDGILFAMESYLYSYVNYTINSIELVNYINETNPDAKVVIMGNYNPIKNAFLEIEENVINIGDLYSVVTFSYNAELLLQYSTSSNSTFIYIFDAKSVYDDQVEEGQRSGDIFDFLMTYVSDKSLVNLTDESNEYVASQMLAYVKNVCENHKYTNDCDTTCNRCEKEREVTHHYTDCDDTVCNLCGHEREAIPHIYEHCEDWDCATCGKERAKTYHALDGCEDTLCEICGMTVPEREHNYDKWTVTKEATVGEEGEESAKCTSCGHTITRAIPALTETPNEENGGLVIGIVIGSILLIAIAAFCIYKFVLSKKESTPSSEEQESTDKNADKKDEGDEPGEE